MMSRVPGVEREPARAEEAEAPAPVEVVHGVHDVVAPLLEQLLVPAGDRVLQVEHDEVRGALGGRRLDVLRDGRGRGEVRHLDQELRLEVDDSIPLLGEELQVPFAGGRLDRDAQAFLLDSARTRRSSHYLVP